MKETNLEHLKMLREDIIKKWEAAGFLDGLKGHIKENIAELYQCCKSCTIPNDLKTDLSEGL